MNIPEAIALIGLSAYQIVELWKNVIPCGDPLRRAIIHTGSGMVAYGLYCLWTWYPDAALAVMVAASGGAISGIVYKLKKRID